MFIDKDVILLNPNALIATPLTRRDLTVDNFETMRREHYCIDGKRVTSWVSAMTVEQMRAAGRPIEPWGTYERPHDEVDGSHP